MENITFFLKEPFSNTFSNASDAASGQAASGQAASGQAASGQAASGQAASGEGASGEANEVVACEAEICINYAFNYNIKSLNQILNYYGINKSKMLKDEMIQVLIFYETDPVNREIVKRRLRLWQNISELKNDAYFGKYILFNVI